MGLRDMLGVGFGCWASFSKASFPGRSAGFDVEHDLGFRILCGLHLGREHESDILQAAYTVNLRAYERFRLDISGTGRRT